MNRDTAGDFPEPPPRIPRSGGAFARWIGRTALRLLGWRITGNLPDIPKFIAIGAPHTSNLDGILAVATKFALNLDMHYLMKHTAFRWPLGAWMRYTGGIAINREAPGGIVGDVVRAFETSDALIVCITPEGTRDRVEEWKTGFLRIAEQAKVPVVLISWNYPDRTLHLGPIAELSGDTDADIARLRDYYRQFTGKHPERQSP